MESKDISDLGGRLRVGRLVSRTVRLLAAHKRSVGVFWVVATGLYVVSETLESRDPSLTEALFSPMFLVESALVGVLSLCLARMLLGASPVWRLSRGGAVFAAVDFACSCLVAGWWATWPWFHPTVTAVPEDYQLNFIAWFPETAAWIVAGVAVWWILVRSALWIFDQAAGEGAITLPGSWRATRGAVWAVIAATTLLAILPSELPHMVLEAFDLKARGGAAAMIDTLLGAAADGWFCVAVSAVPAALYRLRGGKDGPASALAEVFD